MRLLVVEDEEKMARALQVGLTEEGHSVDLCYDGEDGFGEAASGNFDLVVMDRMLPGLDGDDIIRRLRSAGNHVPVIMLTAKGEIGDRVTGLDAGADDYLVKPFSFEELLARIRALLRRPPEGGSNQLCALDLVLDTAAKTVTRGGTHIRLSYKEFHLLEYLLRNKNRVLSRNAIINHVWEFESDVLPSTVEVFIVYLRAKIDRPFKTKLIKTVRGFGYMLEDQP